MREDGERKNEHVCTVARTETEIRIAPLDVSRLPEAGRVYAEAWQASHAGLVSDAFLKQHTPEERAAALTRAMETPGNEVYTAFLKEETAGILICSVGAREIVSLYVAPACWNRGVGGALLDFALARMPGTQAVSLTVMNRNARARAFYAGHGFHPSGKERVLNAGAGISELTYIR